MERLTKKIDSCTVFPEELVGVTLVPDNPIMCKMLLSLAAYEDTGLEPEICAEYKKFEDEIVASGKTFNHLIELLRAEKEGRVMVLPCKVGQRVFALMDTDKHISECEVKQIGLGNEIGFVGIEPIGARGREYGVSIKGFGKTVFLTREEAEVALEAME